MFSGSSFAENAFSEISVITSGIVGSSDVVIFFNNSFLEFPLELNTEAELNLDINTQQDHSLVVNKTLEFNAER